MEMHDSKGPGLFSDGIFSLLPILKKCANHTQYHLTTTTQGDGLRTTYYKKNPFLGSFWLGKTT